MTTRTLPSLLMERVMRRSRKPGCCFRKLRCSSNSGRRPPAWEACSNLVASIWRRTVWMYSIPVSRLSDSGWIFACNGYHKANGSAREAGEAEGHGSRGQRVRRAEGQRGVGRGAACCAHSRGDWSLGSVPSADAQQEGSRRQKAQHGKIDGEPKMRGAVSVGRDLQEVHGVGEGVGSGQHLQPHGQVWQREEGAGQEEEGEEDEVHHQVEPL